MDYEKAYNEALERARSGMQIDKVFPELKESEDERIRKQLLNHCYQCSKRRTTVVNIEDYIRWIAWLEKQKYKYEVFEPIESTLEYKEGFKAGVESERQKEQKPAEWSKDYREEDLRTRFAFYTYKDDDSVLYLSNVFVEEASRNHGFGTKILAAAEKVAETLGANAIRLKVKQNSPANAWYRKHGYGYMAFEGDYDWLEKTLEYLKPKKKEWSEEDERIRESAILYLENSKDVCARACSPYINECIKWLNSLHTKPHWKPSEEQMAALNEASVSWMNEKMGNSELLESLYNDLKKL